jgi:hypothetical protein
MAPTPFPSVAPFDLYGTQLHGSSVVSSILAPDKSTLVVTLTNTSVVCWYACCSLFVHGMIIIPFEARKKERRKFLPLNR